MKVLTGLFVCALLALNQAADVIEVPEVDGTFYEAEAGNWTDPEDVGFKLAAEETAADEHSQIHRLHLEGSRYHNQRAKRGLPTRTQRSTTHLVRGSCPVGWSKFNNRCFSFIANPMTWARAQRNCGFMQATLASVHDDQEYYHIQRVIAASAPDSPLTWIGGSDAQEERIWLWSDGRPFHYSNWCPGEPDNLRGQHCIQMNFGASKCWDDLQCKKLLPSVCAKNV
ncbi:type-2 ice-structuring protein-like [Fundulus diaphanus]